MGNKERETYPRFYIYIYELSFSYKDTVIFRRVINIYYQKIRRNQAQKKDMKNKK